jgi:hypothetical protein
VENLEKMLVGEIWVNQLQLGKPDKTDLKLSFVTKLFYL